VLKVLVNKLQLSEAIGACHLDGSLSVDSLHYHVEKARRLLLVDSREGLVVKIQKDDEEDDIIIYNNILPLSNSSVERPKTKARRKSKTRQTSHQASVTRLEQKATKESNNKLYREAFKEATLLVSESKQKGDDEAIESSQQTCLRLNKKYGLNEPGRRQLSKSTVNRLVNAGRAGLSPRKRGPDPRIPVVLLT
jgi:hypothetical protein